MGKLPILSMLIIGIILLGWRPAFSSSMSLSAPITLNFSDTYYGAPGFYATVSGTASSSGTIQLVSDGTEYYLSAALFLIIDVPPGGSNGFGFRTWEWFPQNLTNGVVYSYSMDEKTASATAAVFLPDENSIVPVNVRARIAVDLWRNNQSNPEFLYGPFVTKQVEAIATPEPSTLLLLGAGLGGLVIWRRRT